MAGFRLFTASAPVSEVRDTSQHPLTTPRKNASSRRRARKVARLRPLICVNQQCGSGSSIGCVRNRQDAVGMLRVKHPLQQPGFFIHADPPQLADQFDTVALGALLRRNLWQVSFHERNLHVSLLSLSCTFLSALTFQCLARLSADARP